MNVGLAPVQLARLHAVDSQGPGGQPLGRLHGVTLLLYPGVHAFVGGADDGSVALAEALSGRRRPRIGAVLVGQLAPATSPRVRARIGSLLLHPDLPPTPTVCDAIAWVGKVRGHTDDDPLGALGIADLTARPLGSLRLDEARAVELALALSVPAPLAMVLHEPFRDVAGADREAIRRRLVERAESGVVVVITTDAIAEVEGFAEHLYALRRGRLVDEHEVGGWPAHASGEIVLALEGRDRDAARRLADALGARQELSGVGWHQHGHDGKIALRVRADDLEGAAMAVVETVATQRVEVLALYSRGAQQGADRP